MVRRWSYINLFNFEEKKKNSFFLKKSYKLTIFKKSVSLKRFNKKYTKFRRKAFNRLKHQSNWMIYHNVFKFWSKDYLFNKNYARRQYFEGFFLNNFLFFNFNFIKNRNINTFYNWNFYFFNFSKKTFFYFYKHKFSHLNLKNSTITKGWYFSTIDSNNLAFPIYSEWDKNFFPIGSGKQFFNLNFFFETLNLLLIKKLNEYYKILVLLYFFFN